MNIEIPIFTPGTHTAMNGVKRTYSDNDLIAIAHAYNPDLFDAPIVIGHPEHDHPAWGWVERLTFRDGSLWASLRDLHDSFVERVRAKQFKKISASFYPPDSPANPKPGNYYLRHIGFLGAVAPSLKSLPPVNLSESDGAIVYEANMYGHPAANLMQSGLPTSGGQPINHTETNPMPGTEDDRIKEIEAEKSRLEAENARLKAESAQYQEQAIAAQTTLAERERATMHDGHVAFCEKLINEGRLLPVNKAIAVAALDLIAAQEKPLTFSESDGQAATLTADKFKSALQAFPVVVDYSERAADGGDPVPAQRKTNVPAGYEVDPKAAELHNKALAYMDKNPGIDYVAAVAAVQR